MTNPPELPAAALHASICREPHVDSEEAVRYERRRVSRELVSIDAHKASRSTPGRTTLRSRNASTTSQDISDHQASDTDTQPDTARPGQNVALPTKLPHCYDPITNFWNAHISLTIEEGAHRDHLALERTFLAYLRTSLVLVMTGVTTAQLFRLQHAPNTNPTFGFYVIGRPLSALFISMAILVVLVGAFRFWKLQGGLVRGKAYAGGWEVLLVMGLSGLLLAVTFALVLGVGVEKSLGR